MHAHLPPHLRASPAARTYTAPGAHEHEPGLRAYLQLPRAHKAQTSRARTPCQVLTPTTHFVDVLNNSLIQCTVVRHETERAYAQGLRCVACVVLRWCTHTFPLTYALHLSHTRSPSTRTFSLSGANAHYLSRVRTPTASARAQGPPSAVCGILRRSTYTSPPTYALHPSLARLPRLMSTNTNAAFAHTYTFPSTHKTHPSHARTPCQVFTPTPHRAHAHRSRVRRIYIFPRVQKHTESGTLACCRSRPRTSPMG